MKVQQHLLPLLTLLAAFQAPAHAGQFAFVGTFIHDNDLQLFTFTLGAPSTVTLQTWGYGGGTNAAGQVIPAGGFESVLGIFDSAGTAVSGPIEPGPNPDCSPRNPDPARFGFCQDAYGQISLAAGSYIVSLTQFPNDPLGNLSDGFFYINTVPDPNFNNGFVGTFGLPGNGNWALDITGVDSAAAAGAVPEPGTLFMGCFGLAMSMVARRRATRNETRKQ